MYCSKCGSQNPDKGKFCVSCGSALALVAESDSPRAEKSVPPVDADALAELYPETAAPKSGMSPAWKRALIVGAIIVIGNILWFGARPYIIGVTIDATTVEQNIESTYSDSGISVTAECPDPFVARPGETRNCLVTDDYGTKVMAVVTVENTNGDITWVAQ